MSNNITYTHCVKFLLCHVRSIGCCDSTEGIFDFFRALYVLGFLTDHESHVLLQGDVPVAIRIHDICNFIENNISTM